MQETLMASSCSFEGGNEWGGVFKVRGCPAAHVVAWVSPRRKLGCRHTRGVHAAGPERTCGVGATRPHHDGLVLLGVAGRVQNRRRANRALTT